MNFIINVFWWLLGMAIIGLAWWVTLWLVRNAGSVMMFSFGLGITAAVVSAIIKTYKEFKTKSDVSRQREARFKEELATNSTKKAA